ncbi:MAG TPA: diaminopimelate epimerase [Candidatus Cloacimonas sp.]|jgi:diaminopimelate epimerase|nr:diaminopimelate epimerase [Candidatus Cloacimonas sp.]
MKFIKMHAQGNDYIYFDFLQEPLPKIDFTELARDICRQHFGVGADGIVLLLPDTNHDARMRMFNADGSESAVCGSALRSIAAILYRKTGKKKFTINTNKQTIVAEVTQTEPVLITQINLGLPKLASAEKLLIEGFSAFPVDVGNLHFPVFVEKFSKDIPKKLGAKMEYNDYYPEGINVEFARLISPTEIELEIWERGSGATLACGTGACATVFSGISQGFLQNRVKVKVPGGELQVSYQKDGIYLAGKVDFVFKGELLR